jgi:hypothetical protein
MSAMETGRITKNNITLIEYSNGIHVDEDRFFIQSGIAGIFASKQELNDLYSVLNYYLNIESFSECTIKVDGEHVAIQ